MSFDPLLLVMLIFLGLVRRVLSLKCFECRGVDEESCRRDEELNACPNKILRPSCLTLIYEKSRDIAPGKSVKEKTFEKKCVDKFHECQLHCDVLDVINVKKEECWSVCCDTDGCNRSRARRSGIGKRSNSFHSSSAMMSDDLFYLVVGSVFIGSAIPKL